MLDRKTQGSGPRQTFFLFFLRLDLRPTTNVSFIPFGPEIAAVTGFTYPPDCPTLFTRCLIVCGQLFV